MIDEATLGLLKQKINQLQQPNSSKAISLRSLSKKVSKDPKLMARLEQEQQKMKFQKKKQK